MSQQERKHRRRTRTYKKAQRHYVRFLVKQALRNNDDNLFLIDIVKYWRKRMSWNNRVIKSI
jgi:hypothetical protein